MSKDTASAEVGELLAAFAIMEISDDDLAAKMREIIEEKGHIQDFLELRVEGNAERYETVFIAVVTAMIKNGYEINDPMFEGGETYLHYAVMDGLVNAVDFLIKSGADVKVADSEGNTPKTLAQESFYDNPAGYRKILNILGLVVSEGAAAEAVVDEGAVASAVADIAEGAAVAAVAPVEGGVAVVDATPSFVVQHSGASGVREDRREAGGGIMRNAKPEKPKSSPYSRGGDVGVSRLDEGAKKRSKQKSSLNLS